MSLIYGLPAWQSYHPRNDPNAPIVLCFGDSWFWYPIPGIGNLCNRFVTFARHEAIDFVALGAIGMDIADPGKPLLTELQTFMQWEARSLDLIMVSGGGNDIAGPEDLDPLLQPGTPDDISTWFQQMLLQQKLARIAAGFQRVVHLRDTFCPQVPIVTHGYDYAHASGLALLWFSPWIRPSLDAIGMPRAMHSAAVRYVVDRLVAIQLTMAASPGYAFIDTRGTLTAQDWDNELHPTGAGFDKLARHFYPLLERTFPGWVHKPRWL